MRDRLKNNIGFKLVAVLIAILLWWIVVNVDDPVVTKKFTAEVKVTHTEVITNIGKSYQIEDDMKKITVTVKARRKVINQIRTSDIVATADFREMQNNSVPIRIEIQGFEGQYVEASANPRNLQIQTEDTLKKTFPITTATIGSIQDGCVLGTLTAQPQTIDISGPKSLIGRISKVVARVNVSELSESSELKAEVIYYDSADNVIDQKLLSSNCDKNGVMVSVEILETKKVDLTFDTSGIQPAIGYVFEGIIAEPQSILVSGTEEALSKVQHIEISGVELEYRNLTESKDIVIDITKYLPEGIELEDKDANSVVVSISIAEAGTKSIMIPVRSVRVDNSSEDMELIYGPEQEVELRFTGSEENLDKLEAEDLVVCIDMNTYMQEGTYNVMVQVLEAPEGCTYIGKAFIQVTLKQNQ